MSVFIIVYFLSVYKIVSDAKVYLNFDICKYLVKFFSSFLHINFYVFAFQRVANFGRKKKMRLFAFTQIYKGLALLYRFGCAFVGVVRFK